MHIRAVGGLGTDYRDPAKKRIFVTAITRGL
jgi:hypothetical protein